MPSHPWVPPYCRQNFAQKFPLISSQSFIMSGPLKAILYICNQGSLTYLMSLLTNLFSFQTRCGKSRDSGPNRCTLPTIWANTGVHPPAVEGAVAAWTLTPGLFPVPLGAAADCFPTDIRLSSITSLDLDSWTMVAWTTFRNTLSFAKITYTDCCIQQSSEFVNT